MAAASRLLRLSRCGYVQQNQLSRDLPQLIVMKILQSGFDLRVTRADCRFLDTNARSLGSNSSYCSRGSCSISSNDILLYTAEYILTAF